VEVVEGAKSMTAKPWQSLLQSVLETEVYEIDCVECFELLDQYADLILDGANPNEIMPLVKQHLGCCHCCAHEFEAVIMILQEAAKGQQL
jgi:hypothetical protein